MISPDKPVLDSAVRVQTFRSNISLLTEEGQKLLFVIDGEGGPQVLGVHQYS